MSTTVVKRDGVVEGLDLNKIHVMVEHACKGVRISGRDECKLTVL